MFPALDHCWAFSRAMASWVSPSSSGAEFKPNYWGVTGARGNPCTSQRNFCCLAGLVVASNIGVLSVLRLGISLPWELALQLHESARANYLQCISAFSLL